LTGATTFWGKQKKEWEARKLQELGAKKAKKEKVPYNILMGRLKKQGCEPSPVPYLHRVCCPRIARGHGDWWGAGRLGRNVVTRARAVGRSGKERRSASLQRSRRGLLQRRQIRKARADGSIVMRRVESCA
jgi:hypothetical protein